MRLISSEGRIVFLGRDIQGWKNRELRRVRRDMQMVFQDPYGSLSPRMSIEQIVAEGLGVHGLGDEEGRVAAILKEVGLDPETAHRYPHEFSGGQRQRIAIARAMILQPKLVVLDEPTSALDMTVQVQIVELLRRLQAKYGLAYVFVSHDLRVVRALAHTVVVMQNGDVVESGDSAAIFERPADRLHPHAPRRRLRPRARRGMTGQRQSRAACAAASDAGAIPMPRNRPARRRPCPMPSLGPVEYVVIRFSGDRLTGDILPALNDAPRPRAGPDDRHRRRQQGRDGSVSILETQELGPEIAEAFLQLTGEASGLLSEADLQELAETLDPGTTAAAFLFEHVWATRFARRRPRRRRRARVLRTHPQRRDRPRRAPRSSPPPAEKDPSHARIETRTPRA